MSSYISYQTRDNNFNRRKSWYFPSGNVEKSCHVETIGSTILLWLYASYDLKKSRKNKPDLRLKIEVAKRKYNSRGVLLPFETT